MTKHDFKLHTIDTAPEGSRKDLATVKQKYGRVPNFFAKDAKAEALHRFVGQIVEQVAGSQTRMFKPSSVMVIPSLSCSM